MLHETIKVKLGDGFATAIIDGCSGWAVLVASTDQRVRPFREAPSNVNQPAGRRPNAAFGGYGSLLVRSNWAEHWILSHRTQSKSARAWVQIALMLPRCGSAAAPGGIVAPAAATGQPTSSTAPPPSAVSTRPTLGRKTLGHDVLRTLRPATECKVYDSPRMAVRTGSGRRFGRDSAPRRQALLLGIVVENAGDAREPGCMRDLAGSTNGDNRPVVTLQARLSRERSCSDRAVDRALRSRRDARAVRSLGR